MNAISTNYRALSADEIATVAQECGNAWQDPEIPRRQYELAVKPELEKFRRREPCVAFDPLLRCLRTLPLSFLANRPRLLDIGASSGYYSQVLAHGFAFIYTGCDSSPAFQQLAKELYPGITFDVEDACALQYADESFDIVLSGACLMHCHKWERALWETVRVARQYAVFHRTPVFSEKPTTFFEKEAYGVRCLEVHFNEQDFLQQCFSAGLDLLNHADVFWNAGEGFGHRTYLFRKVSLGEREWERA